MNPMVSLVTPVYNAMPWIQNYLASVMAQTWRPLQFLVVDDGSTDGSYEYLLSQQNFLKRSGITVSIQRIEHGGQAVAVNTVLPQVQGDYFSWCDADDILLPENLQKKVAFLQENVDYGMVRTDGFVCREDGRYTYAARNEDKIMRNIFDPIFNQTTYVCTGCYMIRSQLLFQCYPKKQIPVSPEGQNLQLLLPPASRTECGFIPDYLFIYYLRSGGHSSRKRSYSEQITRVENFARLRHDILPYCDCDQQYYAAETEKIRMREREVLLNALLHRIREEMIR